MLSVLPAPPAEGVASCACLLVAVVSAFYSWVSGGEGKCNVTEVSDQQGPGPELGL